MNILITTDLYNVDTNGVVTSVRNLQQELLKKGHEVRILTVSRRMRSYREGAVYYIKSVPIGAVYPDMRMPVSYRNPFLRELVKWKPDVIHSQCEFFSYQFARYISKKTGAPIVHTYHTLYEQYVGYVFPSRRLGRRVVKRFSRRRLRKSGAIIAPTHKVENVLRGYGVRNSIHVVPSGITLKQHGCRISQEQRLEKRKALGIPEDSFVLLNLGRLGTEKNLTEVVAFFAEAAKKDPILTLLIVGDGPARGELEALASHLGIADRVVFTGMVDPKKVQEYYQLGDLFVSASTSETQGLTYIEAAANGLPLLCRQDPCLDEILRPGENGYSYRNLEEYLRYLNAAVIAPQWRAAAGQRSAEIAATFDKSSFGTAVEAVYRSVLI